MQEVLLIIIAVLAVGFFLFIYTLKRKEQALSSLLTNALEEKHRGMLNDLHSQLTLQSDRMQGVMTHNVESLRGSITEELKAMHALLQRLQLELAQSLATNRETVIKELSELNTSLQTKQDALRTEILTKLLQTLAEQGRAEQELIQNTMRNTTEQLTASVTSLTKTTDERLQQISGKVSERLDEGFKKTNETFTNVMTRLATIDEAQKKIDGLTTNVISLQELLGDKRSRGVLGEVQLEALVRNILPITQQPCYAIQHTLSNGARADCVLFLPEPTGKIAVDSKFPLENYHRMLAADTTPAERSMAQRQFKADIRKHIDDISRKYIIANDTSDGAVMFIPAEAVFAEVHAYHADLIEYAMQKRVWVVSPTTLMAVLNTARAVLKDVETRKQVHIIKDALAKLGKDFNLFDKRMKNLADHIRLANKDVEEVHISSRKITQRFAQIEAVNLEQPQQGLIAEIHEKDIQEVE